MTRNRGRKAAIRAHQAATGTPYMVAFRQITEPVPPTTPPVRVEVLPPLADWTRRHSCDFWSRTTEEHGELIALSISRGDGWWGLDDLAREVAGALQETPAEERGLWIGFGRYSVTKREHLGGIVAALDAAGALSRLTVRAVPDAARCEHASCRRRRGEPPMSAGPTAPRTVSRPQLPPPTLSLAEVMEQHPLLNTHGIGVYSPRTKTRQQREAELAQGRNELRACEERVMDTVAWLLGNVAPIRTPDTSSYGMKHVMEQATGRYVTNGEFIAAAIIAGYTYKYMDGPNVLFGMSARDVNRIRSAAR